jgi:hypothetical protein
MERTRIFRISIAGQLIEALGINQPPGTMLGHRSCERLLGLGPGAHRDTSK